MASRTKTVRAKAKQIVLDYSFMEIVDVCELPRHEPEVEGQPTRLVPLPPVLDADDGTTDYGDDVLPLLPPPTRHAEALRLANNRLSSLSGLGAVLSTLLVSPSATLLWLDISCNALSQLSDEVTLFPRLTTLHAHGNRLPSLAALRPLKRLAHLKAVSFHGNPVEAAPHYRNCVLSMLPLLAKLDFSIVTARDRELAQVWRETHRTRMARARRRAGEADGSG